MALYSLANQAGALFRAALNTALGKLHRNYYGTVDPASVGESTPGMWWVDTNGAAPVLKIRNAADDAWITVGTLGTGFEAVGTTAFTRSLLNDADAAEARTTLGVDYGWQRISRTTPPAGGPLNLSLDSSLYDAYEIIVSGMRTNAANTGLAIALSANGGSSFLNLRSTRVQVDMETAFQSQLAWSTASFSELSLGSVENGGVGWSGRILISNLNARAMLQFQGTTDPAPNNPFWYVHGGAIALANGCNYVRLSLTGMQALGAVTLLGLRRP